MTKFLLSAQTKLLGGFFVAAAIIVTAVVLSLLRHVEFGEEFQRPVTAVEVYQADHVVSLVNTDGTASEQTFVTIIAGVDDEANTIYLGTYVRDYNRRDWSDTDKELLPPSERHTGINHTFSRTIVLHPPAVTIVGQEQRAYLVPDYAWDQGLKPFEDHEEAQIALEGGQMLVEWLLGRVAPANFFEPFIRRIREAQTAESHEIAERIRDGYVATVIPSQVPTRIVGYTETARESRISVAHSDSPGPVDLYIWQKIALGDSSLASHGSFPNRYGELDDIVIKVTLDASGSDTVDDHAARNLGKDRILFTSLNDAGIPSIFLLLPDGSGASYVIDGIYPRWSPNGSGDLAFLTLNSLSHGESALYVMNIHTKQVRKLSDGPISINKHPWSPDGQELAFVRHEGRGTSLYMVSRDGARIRRLLSSEGRFHHTSPLWGPRGESIVFLSDLDHSGLSSRREIYVINVSTGEVNQVVSLGFRTYASHLTASPDRRRFAYHVTDHYSDHCGINVVDIDGTRSALVARGVWVDTPQWSRDCNEVIYRRIIYDSDHISGDVIIESVNTLTGEVRTVPSWFHNSDLLSDGRMLFLDMRLFETDSSGQVRPIVGGAFFIASPDEEAPRQLSRAEIRLPRSLASGVQSFSVLAVRN